MSITALVNEALFQGIKNTMIEEQFKIPTNSGFSQELLKVKK
jgi:hypothetical protein